MGAPSTRRPSVLLAATAAAAAAAAVAAALSTPSSALQTSGSGDATYYGGTTSGHCSLSPVPAQYGNRVPVAVGPATYAGSSSCGACLAATSTGTGAGEDPPPSAFDAYIADECPECAAGDLDLGIPGDGRWDVAWQVVDCPVMAGGPELLFQGSNPFYAKVQVRNVPRPVVGVTVGGVSATRVPDNFWVAHGAFGSGGVQVVVDLQGGGTLDIGTVPIKNDEVLRGDGGGAPAAAPPGDVVMPTPTPGRTDDDSNGGKNGNEGGGNKGGDGGDGGGGGSGRGRNSGCASVWGQCAGVHHAGPKCCVAGSSCTYINDYYSQCKP
ncbi:hypothetical protein MMPV_001466 [Pyropia vietnamensis]